jgi:hypothetical protein
MMNKRLVRRNECIKRLAVGPTKFHSDIVARAGASEHIPGTDVPRLHMIHLGPRTSAAIEDELENVIEGLRAARGAKEQFSELPTRGGRTAAAKTRP